MNGTVPWQLGKRIRVPKKTDPKSFITNERYFLRWVGFGVFLAMVGIAALTAGARTVTFGNELVEVCGLFLVLIAVVVMVYALLVFNLRSRRMFAKYSVRTDDTVGPVLLTAALIAALTFMGLSALSNYILK